MTRTDGCGEGIRQAILDTGCDEFPVAARDIPWRPSA